MRIVVDRMPDSPRDCLFSKRAPKGDFYICTLREYISEADTKENGYKPKCICKDVCNCNKLCREML